MIQSIRRTNLATSQEVWSLVNATAALSRIRDTPFVVEYKTARVYPRSERDQYEAMYTLNAEPCMVLDVQTPQGWQCLDATRKFGTLGRLLNHAAAAKATVKPYRPLLVNGKWRVGFVATRDLKPGTELTWDYGCQPKGQQWLMRRASKVS